MRSSLSQRLEAASILNHGVQAGNLADLNQLYCGRMPQPRGNRIYRGCGILPQSACICLWQQAAIKCCARV